MSSGDLCYNCGLYGHLAKDLRSARTKRFTNIRGTSTGTFITVFWETRLWYFKNLFWIWSWYLFDIYKGSFKKHFRIVEKYKHSNLYFIQFGYKIPLLNEPEFVFLLNNKSALDNKEFVEKAIMDSINAISSDMYIFWPMTFLKSCNSFVLRKSNVNLSYSRAREIFRSALSELGFNSSDFGLHSFRTDGASAAVQNNIFDRLFKMHGVRNQRMPKMIIFQRTCRAVFQFLKF